MSPPRPTPEKLSVTRGFASTLRTRAPGWLYMATDSAPSQMNQTGMGSGEPAGVTVVIQTTISSRRCRATRAPNSVPSSITASMIGLSWRRSGYPRPMDAIKVGQHGLTGWRVKVADGAAKPFESRTKVEPDQVRAVLGALFFLLSIYYVISTSVKIAGELRS